MHNQVTYLFGSAAAERAFGIHLIVGAICLLVIGWVVSELVGMIRDKVRQHPGIPEWSGARIERPRPTDEGTGYVRPCPNTYSATMRRFQR